MNWGIRITIVYVGFVILITSLVVISSKNKSELVAKDYYQQELKYQERIDAINNEKQLDVTINSELGVDAITITYPLSEQGTTFSGEVFFFRPSDDSKDLKIKLKFDKNGKQVIEKSKLAKGLYKMSITWYNNNKTFYTEKIITI